MRKISQVNLLVHPDYDARGSVSDTSELHPLQVGLRSAWEERIGEIAGREDAMLIYLTALSPESTRKGLDDENLISNPWDREDISRIKRWKSTLGERFVLFHEENGISHVVFNHLTEFRFKIDPSSELIAFGEYAEQCVNYFAQNFRSALGITTRPRIETRLSLSIYEQTMVRGEKFLRRRAEF